VNGDERTQIDALRAEVRELKAEVKTLSAQMGAWLVVLNDPEFGIRPVLKDHESRLRSTERWKLSLPISIVLVIASIVGGAIGLGK
jgi:hypothetical protein